jgi:ubiquinone/menaquinone biosynthesis C-methylase UbiE
MLNAKSAPDRVKDFRRLEGLAPGEEMAASSAFKLRDAASYDPLIEQFDSFSELLTVPLARRLVDLAGPERKDRVLDIGTGTGVVALETASRLMGNGQVDALDLSEGMLMRASAKARSRDLNRRVSFYRMDAENLAFAERSYDCVVSLFALLHFPDPAAALKEMYRVLKPGGTLVIGVGSAPRLASLAGFRALLKAVPEKLNAALGRELRAPAMLDKLVARHIAASQEMEESDLAHSHSNRSESVLRLVKSAGFQEVTSDWFGHRASIENPADFWEIQRTFSSLSRKRLERASPKEVESLEKEFFSDCNRVQSKGGRLVYPFAAFYVKAKRPLR